MQVKRTVMKYLKKKQILARIIMMVGSVNQGIWILVDEALSNFYSGNGVLQLQPSTCTVTTGDADGQQRREIDG